MSFLGRAKGSQKLRPKGKTLVKAATKLSCLWISGLVRYTCSPRFMRSHVSFLPGSPGLPTIGEAVNEIIYLFAYNIISLYDY